MGFISLPRSCVKLLKLNGIFGCGICWCWYSDTCEVSVICHIWPHHYGISKFLRYYTWSLLHKVATSVSWNLAAMFPFYTHVTNLRLPTDLNNFMIFGPKSSFISKTAFRPLSFHPFCTSMGNILEFSRSNWPITISIHSQVYVPVFQFHACFWSLNSTFAQV
jgi:hypothetical protein